MLNNLRNFLKYSDSSSSSSPNKDSSTTTTPTTTTTINNKKKGKTAVLSVGVDLEQAFGKPTTSDEDLFIFGGNGAIRLASPPKRPARPTSKIIKNDDPITLVFIRSKSPESSSITPSTTKVIELAKPRKRKTIILQNKDEEEKYEEDEEYNKEVEKLIKKKRQEKLLVQQTLERMKNEETKLSIGLISPLPNPPPRRPPRSNNKIIKNENNNNVPPPSLLLPKKQSPPKQQEQQHEQKQVNYSNYLNISSPPPLKKQEQEQQPKKETSPVNYSNISFEKGKIALESLPKLPSPPIQLPPRPPPPPSATSTPTTSTHEKKKESSSPILLKQEEKSPNSSSNNNSSNITQEEEEEEEEDLNNKKIPPPKRSEHEKRQALTCKELIENKSPKALQVCEEWKKLNPKSGEAWFMCGRAHLLRGEITNAENNFLTSQQLDENLSSKVQHELTRIKTLKSCKDKCLQELGSSKKSSHLILSHALRGKEISPCNSQICVLTACAYLINKDETFKRELDESLLFATDLISQLAKPAAQYARIMHRCGMTYEADCLLEEVCNRSSNNKICLDLLRLFRQMESAKSDGNEAYSQGRFLQSIQLFTDALNLDQANELYNCIILSNRAASYMALGEYEKAVDDCDMALRLVPSFLRARLRRARSLLKMNKFREAIADFELAMRVNPSPTISNELTQARKAFKENQEKKKMFHSRGFDYYNNKFIPPPPPPPPPPTQKYNKREDLYKILGISPQATSGDIKKAYHKAALKHHPDKNVGDDEASQRFKKVLEAFHTLSDPISRRRYDLTCNSVGVPMI